MANTVFKLRRSSVAGKVPNTSTLAIGELALNLTDKKLYSSDGTNVFEPAANVSTLNIANVFYLQSSSGRPNIRLGTTGQYTYIEHNNGGNQTLSITPFSGNFGTHFSFSGRKLGIGNYQYTDFLSTTIFQVGNSTANSVNLRIDEDGSVNVLRDLKLSGAVYANGSAGSAGEILASNGSAVYWKSDFDFSTNTAASYTWTNNHIFQANVTTNNLIISTVTANSSVGVNGQVLASNGSSTYWFTPIGGVVPLRQQYTGDGTTTTFTVTGGYVANSISVFVNGVLLRNGTEVTVTSGSTFTISPAPSNGALIDVVGPSQLYSTGVNTIVSQQFTANGSANSFAVTGGYIANSILVFLNGVKQIPGTDVDITSGANVGFYSTPSNNFVIDVYGYQTMVSLGANTITVGSNLTIGTGSISIGNSTVNTQIYAGNIALNGSELRIGNSSVNTVINNTSTSLGTNTFTVGSSVYVVANGNVGIGNSSPTHKISVNGTAFVNTYLRVSVAGRGSDTAIAGYSNTAGGVYGESLSQSGVAGSSDSGYGVYGVSNSSWGGYFQATGVGSGVIGSSPGGYGLFGQSNSYIGVYGQSNSTWAGYFVSTLASGVYGQSNNNIGVQGATNGGYGVAGVANTGYGVYGTSNTSYGVYGFSNNSVGVVGASETSWGGYFYGPYGLYVGNTTTEHFRVNNDGYLGVGTSTTISAITLRYSSNTLTGRGVISDQGGYTGIKFYGQNDGNLIIYNKRNDPSYGHILLYTGAGNERMRLCTNGFIGIANTQSPVALFDIGSSTTSANTPTMVLARPSGGDGNFVLQAGTGSGTTVNSEFCRLGLYFNTTSKHNAGIGFYRGADEYGGWLTFNVNNWTEAMRIDNNGAVTIGATTRGYNKDQGYVLGVVSNSATQSFISVALKSQTLDTQGIIFGVDTGAGYVWLRDNNALRFGANNTQQMQISANGNVGINTTSPTQALHVAGRITVTGGSYNTNTAGPVFGQYTSTVGYIQAPSNGIIQMWDATTTAVADFGASYVRLGTGGSNSIYVASNGNVGFGTSSPGVRIDTIGDIRATGGQLYLTPGGIGNALVRYNNNGGAAYVGLDSSSGGLGVAYGLHMYHGGAYPIVFSTNATEAMRINSSGFVGIGVNPSYPLHVNKSRNGDVVGGFINPHANGYGLYIETGDTTGNRYGIAIANTTATNIWLYNNGSATFNGTVTVGTLTESSSITVKENVSNLDYSPDSLDLLQGVTYNRIGDTKKEVGLIAEEVFKVLPDIVTLDKNGNPTAIQYTKLSVYLLECIKDLKKEIQELKSR